MGIEITVTIVGRKATESFRRHRPAQLVESYGLSGWVAYDDAAKIAHRLIRRFESGEVDEVVLVYSEFVSTMTQKATMPLASFRR